MAASGLVDHAPADQRYGLSPEQATCFADPESLTYVTPAATLVLKSLEQADRLASAFRDGGGVPFEAYGPLFTKAMDDIHRPTFCAKLVTEWLPAVPGAVEKLQAGGSFLDVGCGGGVVCMDVARAFPEAMVVGIDRNAPSIARAQANAREAGIDRRARFEAVRIEQLSDSTRFDVVTSFDVIHDLADPVGVLRSIRALLAPGGNYVMVEGKGADRLEQGGMEMRTGYGFSVFHCLPQSLAESGVGIGGLMDEATARELAAQAQFSSFTLLAVEDPAKAFYYLSP